MVLHTRYFWRSIGSCLLTITSLFAIAQTPATYSSADILLQLKKLQVLGSVLYVAAHPDDENNTLLPYLAKEKLYRTAYLSLTRGDGGQNLIGSEQGIALGLIRTQELLAARRIDGAEQYFTRAYEFGFSKTATETLRIWDKEKILADVVWLIRTYRPDIIITRFPGDARAGHGHHAASNLLTYEAFAAAADSSRFTEQFAYGATPWQAKRLLWNNYNFGSNNNTAENQLKIEVGGFNALLGKSYGEIGAEARSMHKSQGEGRPRRRGSIIEYFTTLRGDSAKTSLMDGITTSWQRITGGTAIARQLDTLIAQYQIQQPEKSVPALVQLYQLVKQLPQQVWTTQKLADIQTLIEACSGFFAEATVSREQAIPGSQLPVTLLVNQRHAAGIHLQKVSLSAFDTTLRIALPPNTNVSFVHTLPIPSNQPLSQPYWLQKGIHNGLFEVSDQLQIGKATNDPAFEAQFHYQIQGVPFTAKRAVMFKTVDAAKGELYQPLVIIPAIELKYHKDNYVSVNQQPVTTSIHITTNHPDSTASGQLVQTYPTQWQSTVTQPIPLTQTLLQKTVVSGSIWPLTKFSATQTINAAITPDTTAYHTKRINYDHIPNITYFAQANSHLVNVPLRKVGKKIGYIAGAGDKVPEALEQMGYAVTLLQEADLTEENLSQYSAIVTGIRAYNLHEYLTIKYPILMQYIHKGGNLIVQYLRNHLVNGKPVKVAPYPFTVSAASRITNEQASVVFSLPQHPALQYPNPITAADFDGWIQERSTYQAEQIDSRYQTPLTMNDANEAPSKGSLLIAPYGKGNFVYTGLVFFRQLPAGVPGAYRLMANLLALPKHAATH